MFYLHSITKSVLQFLLILFCLHSIFAQRSHSPGLPDRGFGLNGIVTTAPDDPQNQIYVINNAVFQPDGKTVLVGSVYSNTPRGHERNLLLIRYNSDGSFDTSFGDNGISSRWFGSDANGVSSAIQPDGKFLVIAENNGDMAIVRYTSNGKPDKTFGIRGLVKSDLADIGENSTEYPRKIYSLPNGKFLVAGLKVASPVGSTLTENRKNILFVARYDSDGVLDPTFGNNGKIQKPLTYRSAMSKTVLGEDGNIYLNGNSIGLENPLNPYGGYVSEEIIIRYDQEGRLDQNFADGGTFTRSDWSSFQILKVLDNGQLLLSNGPRVLRLNSDGSFDRELIDGYVGEYGSRFAAERFAVQAGGKIVSAGFLPDSGNAPAIAAFFSDGTRDLSFGIHGISLLPYDHYQASDQQIYVQPDGKILDVGVVTNGYPLHSIFMARFYGKSIEQ